MPQQSATQSGLEESLKIELNGATASQLEELTAAKQAIAAENIPNAIKSFERAADAIKNGIRSLYQL